MSDKATDFTNTTKAYDRSRPFHRINSQSYNENRPQITGHGHDCGCHSPEDFTGFAKPYSLRGIMKTVPDWVPVEREGKPPDVTPESWKTLPEVEYEVEGILKESRFAGSDVPWTQWHLWYDWNFDIVPAKGYEYLRGRGNPYDYIECEWDVGAFGAYDFQSSTPTPDAPGPMFAKDWAWPVGGEYMWIAGRWIYDCGHPFSGIATDDGRLLIGDIVSPKVERGKLDPSTVKEITIRTVDGETVTLSALDLDLSKLEVESLVHSELHPCKAVASARWEAFQFDKAKAPVPAIQFMFFACIDGGYISPFPLNDRDYEFIVDLPQRDDLEPFPIGHTPKFPQNTIVLRPRLLVDFAYDPFANAHGPVAARGQADPKIEFLPTDDGSLPNQVKVRIPLTSLTKDLHSYGVIVSLGWEDPEHLEAKKVKRVWVYLDSLEVQDVNENPHGERYEYDWQMKIGVNGRWFAQKKTITQRGQKILLNKLIDLYLAEDDQISITTHGIIAQINAQLFTRSLADRTIVRNAPENTPPGIKGAGQLDQLDQALQGANSDPTALRWEEIDQPDLNKASDVLVAVYNMGVEVLVTTLQTADENNDGRESILPTKHRDGDSPNPLTLKDLRSQRKSGEPLKCQLTAASESSGAIDYVLHYEVRWEDPPANLH